MPQKEALLGGAANPAFCKRFLAWNADLNRHSFDDPAKIASESRIRQAIDGYPVTLLPLIAESYGPDSMQQAWREFIAEKRAQFTGDHAHAELFFSWFFHCWAPSAKKRNKGADPSLYGIPPTRAFLSRHPSDLNPLLRGYLEACLATALGFYQVSECRPGAGFRACDLLAGAEVEVFDRIASSSLRTGAIIFARIPSVAGISVLDAIAPVSFPPSYQKHFIKPPLDSRPRKHSDQGLRKLYFSLLKTYLRAGLPEIRTSSGELVDAPAAYLCGGASACPAGVTLGPEQERDGKPFGETD
jgi:hypothetical protein